MATEPRHSYRCVVVAHDFSDEADRATALGADFLDPREGTLHLLHVVRLVPSVPSGDAVMEHHLNAWTAAQLPSLKKRLGSVRTPAGTPVTRTIALGDPATAIPAYARRVSADLIVLPRRAIPADGSVRAWTAARMLGSAPCSVFFVSSASSAAELKRKASRGSTPILARLRGLRWRAPV